MMRMLENSVKVDAQNVELSRNIWKSDIGVKNWSDALESDLKLLAEAKQRVNETCPARAPR